MLKKYIANCLARHKFVFSKKEALEAYSSKPSSLAASLSKGLRSGELESIGKGIYLIIPPEHRKRGYPPPMLWINDLMKYHECTYYVGLLSAAALHGAAHHAPQVFQVLCDKRIQYLKIGSLKIQYIYSKEASKKPIEKMPVASGYVNVSPLENLAFDLLEFQEQSGHINHIATIVHELADKFKPRALANALNSSKAVYAQRLGYLLDKLGFESKTPLLHRRLVDESVRFIPIVPGTKLGGSKNEKWKIIENEVLDPEI